MRKIFILFLATLCALTQVFAAPLTTPATNLSSSTFEGNTITFMWSPGNGAKRIIIARKDEAVTAVPVDGVDYIASNTFGNGNEISPGQFVVYNGNGGNSQLLNLIHSTTYHIAIFEYNGSGFSTQYLTSSVLSGSKSTQSAPTVAASNITFSEVTGNSMKLNWTNGDGASRLLVARAGSPVNVNPSDLVFYSAITSFGLGDEIGTGNFVVGKAGTGTTVVNLQPNTNYYFALYEFNGSQGPVYLVTTPATASQLTSPRPSQAATNLIYTNEEGNNIGLSFTKGNGAKRIIVAKAGSAVTGVPVDGTSYSADVNFGSGSEISPGEFVVYNGVNTSVVVKELQHSTAYHFAVFEYDGTLASNAAYLTSAALKGSRLTVSVPSTQTSNLTFSNVGSSSITVNWANGNGTKRIVIARKGAAVNVTPETYKQYSSSVAFGAGSQIGTGNYVVYSGTGSSTTILNLSFNSEYHFAVFEFNGTTAPVYLTANPLTGLQSTDNTPSVAASNLFFIAHEGNSIGLQWTSGNGSKRIVIAKAGSAVTAVPVNGTAYTANNNFESGDELAPDEFVVFNGVGNSIVVNNLAIGTTYHFAIFEYNGEGATTAYLTSSFLAGNSSTVSAPTVQASAIQFSNVTGNSVNVSWTNGNGTKRILVGRAQSAVNSDPVNLTSYTQGSVFGSGAQIGAGNYVILAHSSNSSNVFSLQPNTTYHFAVYEYNGSSAPVYLTSTPAMASVTTSPRPTAATTSFNVSNVEGNSMLLTWVNGNGSKRIIIARKESAVTALPADGLSYAASNTFGAGQELQTGQYVVFNGTNNNTTINNLEKGTTYHFAIFEYDGNGGNIGYLTSTFAAKSATTFSTPTIQTTNLLFTSTTNTSMLLNWTNGNGFNRIVITKKGSPVDFVPVDLTSYVASANFGGGSNVGNGNEVVYKGNASSATVANLTPGTTYYFAVYEYNGSTGPVYNTATPAIGNNTTIGAPTDQATDAIVSIINGTSVQLNWTNGSGQKRIVLAKQGSAVDAIPVDNTSYTANSFFESGQQVGSGNYVVFNGTGNSVTVSNLTEGAIYHFAVFEYNDFGASKAYLTTNPARALQNIVLPLTLIDFSVRTINKSVQLNWSTALEANTKEFVVERSIDGVQFTALANVKSAGSSSSIKKYDYTDKLLTINNYSGKIYYRLKQVDADNKFNYSKIVNTSIKAGSSFKIVGNLVSNNLSIAFDRADQSNFTLRIIDMSGRIIIRKQLKGSGIITTDVSGLASGQYIAEVQSGQNRYHERFVKAK